MGKTRVLFLCTANSARSQIAEALLRQMGGELFEVFSAGAEPTRVNPYAIQAMQETGVEMDGHTSKSMDAFAGQQFDYVITLCSDAEERCPFFPGAARRLHWPFDDPADTQGSPAERLGEFRRVRDQISERLISWIAEIRPPVQL